MRFLKAAYVLVLGIAVMLSASLGHAQALTPSGPQVPQTIWNTPDYLTAEERGYAPKTELNLRHVMNFEECVDMKATTGMLGGSECSKVCKIPLSIAWMQFDYYEPIALVESVPKAWATLFKDTENFISRQYTQFKDTPFGGDEGVQPIKTGMGVYPQRHFEVHVWGLSIPTRVLIFLQESAFTPPTDARMIGMFNSLTYELLAAATDMMGLSEIKNLKDLLRKIKDFVMTYFSAGAYLVIKMLEVIKAIYDFVKPLYDAFTAFMKLVKVVMAWVTEPLQQGLKKLFELIVGEDCGEGGGGGSVTGEAYTVPDWSAPPPPEGSSNLGPVANPDDYDYEDDSIPEGGCKGGIFSKPKPGGGGSGGGGDSVTAPEQKKEGLITKLNRSIKAGVKKLGDKFGDIIRVLRLDKAFQVFGNIMKSFVKQLSNFTDGWTDAASGAAKGVSKASATCSNPNWLCSAQGEMNRSMVQNGALTNAAEGPNGNALANASAASASVNNRITEMGGSCSEGRPVGAWGDSKASCDSGGALEMFNRAMDAVNKAQDIFRSGTLINVMGAAAGALLPIGLIPSYISEWDRPSWSKGTPNFISVLQAAAGSAPLLCGSSTLAASMGMMALSDSVRANLCVGIWGPIYPKVGTIIMEEAHKAAGVAGFRGFSIATNWGTLPIPFNPRKSKLKFNVDHPFKGKRCYDIGTPNFWWNSEFASEKPQSAALDAMTGGMVSIVKGLGDALDMAAKDQVKDVKENSSTDGYVHTYWKQTRACAAVCVTGGIKWKKLY